MAKSRKTETDHIEAARDALVRADMGFVAAGGWNLERAIKNSGVAQGLALVACPRGAVDLATCYHLIGDRALSAVMEKTDLAALKIRQRVAFGVKTRLNLADRAIVRRNMALFAQLKYAAEGARLVWATADRIWQGLGDTSEDINWYSKRASLGVVYSATVMFWLGDESAQSQDTWDFLDRRIEGIMAFERFKAGIKDTPIGQGLASVFSGIKKPDGDWRRDFPNHHRAK